MKVRQGRWQSGHGRLDLSGVHWFIGPPHQVPLQGFLTLRIGTQETSPVSTTTVFNQVIPRSFMKRHNYPYFHPVSHDNSHYRRLSCFFKPPYPGTLRFEVFGRRLRIWMVSPGVTRVLRVDFRCCLFFRLCHSTNPRGSTFYVCVYISVVYVCLYVLFAYVTHDGRSILINIDFTVHHSFIVTFLFPGLRFFYSVVINHHL